MLYFLIDILKQDTAAAQNFTCTWRGRHTADSGHLCCYLLQSQLSANVDVTVNATSLALLLHVIVRSRRRHSIFYEPTLLPASRRALSVYALERALFATYRTRVLDVE